MPTTTGNRSQWSNYLLIILIITSTSTTLMTQATPAGRLMINSGNGIKTGRSSKPAHISDEILDHPTSINPPALITSSSSEEVNRKFRVGSFLESLLPAGVIQPFVSRPPKVPERLESQSQPDPPGFLSRLFENVIIDRNSIFRVQFYNTQYETESSENETSSVPNAVFGSPLCWGLCFSGQIYSDNASIRILSDKQFSIIGSRPTSPPPPGEMKLEEMRNTRIPLENVTSGGVHSTSNESDTLGWLPSWPFYSRPLQLLPEQLQQTLYQLG